MPSQMAKPRVIAERYEVLSEIGRGGMGLVARAFDHRLQTEVAVKVLRPGLAMDAADKDGLIKEARVLARLTHPAVVRLFDLAETEVGLMLVLEYVRGPNLAQVLKARSRLTETELIFVMRQICGGLDAAHAEGIVHRDLKPSNLLVAADPEEWQAFQQGLCTSSFLLNARIKITDFGISKLLATRTEADGRAAGDCTWSAAGTPLFMAPEQYQGQVCTAATDIYALGVVAYQALSGAAPFHGDSFETLAEKHMYAKPNPIEGCSPRLNSVILQALAKAPADRFQAAAAFLAALEGTDSPLMELPVWEADPLERMESWAREHKWLLAIVCAGLVAAAVLLFRHISALPQPIAIGGIAARARPDLGKRIKLPVDLDVVPEVASPPSASTAAIALVRVAPHHPRVAWTALVDSDYEQTPWVDGVGPDGTIYVREENLNSLWAIDNGVLRWGYRDARPDGLLNPSIHRNSHADFRDPGRMWLAWCPDRLRDGCRGSVFNARGAGGHTSRVPQGFGQPPITTDVSMPFVENDAQNWRWPDADSRYFCTTRLGAVTLSSHERNWTLPLDGRASVALSRHADGLIVATVKGAVYALGMDGRIEWTYHTQGETENLQQLPSGDLVILDKQRQTMTCVREGKLRWTYKVPGQVAEFQDHVNGAWRFAVADEESTLYFLSESEVSSTLAIDDQGKLRWALGWAEFVRSAGLSLDTFGRLFLTFESYDIDGLSRAGVICISEKNVSR
jgi:serine/threonine protein kinase